MVCHFAYRRITFLVVCVYETSERFVYKLVLFSCDLSLKVMHSGHDFALNWFHCEIDLIESRSFCFLPVSIVNTSENVVICLLDLL